MLQLLRLPGLSDNKASGNGPAAACTASIDGIDPAINQQLLQAELRVGVVQATSAGFSVCN